MVNEQPSSDWQATLFTVVVTRHAIKKARRRFALDSDAQAQQFLEQQLTLAERSEPRRGGMVRHYTAEGICLVTRQLEATKTLVVTCYPRTAEGEMRERRRRLWRETRRLKGKRAPRRLKTWEVEP